MGRKKSLSGAVSSPRRMPVSPFSYPSSLSARTQAISHFPQAYFTVERTMRIDHDRRIYSPPSCHPMLLFFSAPPFFFFNRSLVPSISCSGTQSDKFGVDSYDTFISRSPYMCPVNLSAAKVLLAIRIA